VKQAYLNEDWAKIADLIRWPVTVSGTELADRDAFLAFMEGKTIAETDQQEMEDESCTDLFFNGQGICLGAGEVWIIDESYMTENEPQLRIIALNGIE
jgi:hypothetical protein